MIHISLNPSAVESPYALVRVRFEPFPTTGTSIETRAIIDTGAEKTIVTSRIFEQLDITPLGYQQIRGNGRLDPQRYPRAPVTMTVMDDGGTPHWCDSLVVVASFGGEAQGRIECLLGLDVLRFATFTLEGQLGTAHLGFPGY